MDRGVYPMRVLRHIGLVSALALATAGCATDTSQNSDGGPSDALPPDDGSPPGDGSLPGDGSTPPPPLPPLATTRAVDDVSFDVAPGEIFGFLGPNGAGKTTTFNVLCGLQKAEEGRVRLDGRDL